MKEVRSVVEAVKFFLDYPQEPTDCQKKKTAYKDKKWKYDPRCLPDGQFAPQQCARNVCWCVDRQGEEIPNTRGSRDCDAYGTFYCSNALFMTVCLVL